MGCKYVLNYMLCSPLFATTTHQLIPTFILSVRRWENPAAGVSDFIACNTGPEPGLLVDKGHGDG